MSVKHLKKYYESICRQKAGMEEALKEMSEGVTTKMYTPEQLEGLEKMMEPIKTSYQMLSYVMYLVNMPNKRGKKKKYEIRMEKYLQKLDTKYSQQSILKNNNKAIEEIKSFK